jgi:diguanylate cyclase (GGDEF)-like protein/PAS domain S-box-containing protein
MKLRCWREWLLLIAAFLLGNMVSAQGPEVLPQATETPNNSDNTLYIVQDHAWAPLAFVDENGHPQGLLVDLWAAVGKKVQRPVNFELVDWQHTLRLVQNSENRIHGGMFRSDERQELFDFSEPLLQMRATLFISSGAATQAIIDVRDLDTQAIGVTAGGYEEEFMRVHHPHIRLQYYNNNDQLISAAVRGEIIAFVADYPVGMYYLDRYTTPDKFRVLAVLYQQSIHAGVAKGNRLLLDEINAALAQLGPGEITAINQKWIHNASIKRMPAWLLPFIVSVVVAASFLALVWHNKQLSSRVAQTTRELHEQEKHVLLLTQNMSDWVWTTDKNHRFTYVSPSVKKLLGYDAEELKGSTWEKILHPGENERAHALDAHLSAAAKRGEITTHKDITVELSLRNNLDQIIWTETATRVFFDIHGEYSGAQGSSRNITERKQAEEAIRQLAFNDPLTHLPNRRLLSDRIKQAMAGCSRHRQYCAVLFLDIDNFKYVNDNHGHDNGDALLQQVAQRLSASLRESDTVARFGGDEFILVSEFLGTDVCEARQHALRIAIKTRELFDKDFLLRETTCHLSASIGITLFNSDEKTVATLIKQADLALCQAKANGRNQFFIAEA